MGKAKVRYSDEYVAAEVFAVLIRKERPSRSIPKAELKPRLADPAVYVPLLKLCAEHDGAPSVASASYLQKGLALVIQAIGPVQMQKGCGISRVTLYRMFAPSGNPSLANLLRVFTALGLRLWVVDEDFVLRGTRSRRLKYEQPDLSLTGKSKPRELADLKLSIKKGR